MKSQETLMENQWYFCMEVQEEVQVQIAEDFMILKNTESFYLIKEDADNLHLLLV